MVTNTKDRPDFQPVEFDELDARLSETAARKGIPALISTAPGSSHPSKSRTQASEPNANTPKKTSIRKPINIEVPDYLWTDLKITAAKKMVSVRHLVLVALKEQGYVIAEEELIEDGRRLR